VQDEGIPVVEGGQEMGGTSRRLREVNLQIEHGAWGAFRTEFYPTYDYRPVWEAAKKGRR
jgi:hypothetical protein